MFSWRGSAAANETAMADSKLLAEDELVLTVQAPVAVE